MRRRGRGADPVIWFLLLLGVLYLVVKVVVIALFALALIVRPRETIGVVLALVLVGLAATHPWAFGAVAAAALLVAVLVHRLRRRAARPRLPAP